MLRVLLCMDCCGTPANIVRRQSRTKASTNSGLARKSGSDTNLKDSLVASEKDPLLLLNNQIQANNSDQGGKQANTLAPGNIIRRQEEPEQELLVASTSAPTQQVAPIAANFKGDNDEGRRKLDPFADQSLSSSSSIDIEQFSEHPTNASQEGSVGPRSQMTEENGGNWDSTVAIDTQASSRMLSTTKIGDYARLEYSPVEDLDSVTTASAGKGGSDSGGRRLSAVENANSNRNSPRPLESNEDPQLVGQGMESSSISIASQLSNELQQSLTNMLESANSPLPMFGTIGLPLGPLESSVPETRKTSPETTGAALTSQDSISDGSVQSGQRARPGTAGSSQTTGAALVAGDSMEQDDYDDNSMAIDSKATQFSEQKTAKDISTATPTARVDTPISMATTISASMTNPTPTPSELSGTSSMRKRKRTAGDWLKKLKPRRKKKNK